MLLGGCLLIAIGLTSQFLWGSVHDYFEGWFEEKPTIEYLTTTVVREPFLHTVLERGEIESSSNVEVRCEVRARGSSSTNILEIVPEGTWVEKGEFLVRLDDAGFQTSLIQQQIVCSNTKSAFIEAQATLDAAKLALEEYAEGTFRELSEQQQSAVFVAQENQRRAEEYLRYSKRLAERGYIPEAQLEADAFALEKAKKELRVAETKLEVLQTYTREKKLMELNADIQTAEARLEARQKTWELDKLQLEEIEEQIKRCMIYAPVAGQVVHANNRDGRSSSSSTLLIAEGLPVRERQPIIYLPDPSKMQVVAKVHESRIGDVQPGLIAELRIDAMPDSAFQGRVTEVSEYPLPAVSVYMAHVKEYAVVIEVIDPSMELRPGMTAEVEMLVDRMDDALQIPIEAIVEREGGFYCALPSDDGTLATRAVSVAATSDTVAVIESGLREDEMVVLNVTDSEILEMLDIPEEEESALEVAAFLEKQAASTDNGTIEVGQPIIKSVKPKADSAEQKS